MLIYLITLISLSQAAVKEQISSDLQAAISEVAATTRGFDSTWTQEVIDSIDGYGCWCYFQGEHGKGKGHPVNEVDLQCKILHDGYECTIMDTIPEDCTPWEIAYTSSTGLGLLAQHEHDDSIEDTLRTRCEKINKKKSECAKKACIVENYFVVKLVQHFLAGVIFDPKLNHETGKFDPIEQCPTIQGIESDHACCGTYPIRFPYKTLGGSRDCCVNKTFNAAVLVCCDDGKAKISC